MKLTPREALRIHEDLRQANIPYNVNRTIRAEREAIIKKLGPLARAAGKQLREEHRDA